MCFNPSSSSLIFEAKFDSFGDTHSYRVVYPGNQYDDGHTKLHINTYITMMQTKVEIKIIVLRVR